MCVSIYVLFRCAPPLSKSFSIKCGSNVDYKVTPPAKDRNALYPLTPNSVLIVTMDAVSESANDSKVPTVHPITFVLAKIFTVRAKTVEFFRVWKKILWNRFKQDKKFETEPENLD